MRTTTDGFWERHISMGSWMEKPWMKANLKELSYPKIIDWTVVNGKPNLDRRNATTIIAL
jgi:hypothetical protein